ncbi:hypothetical protein GX50_08534 [[Emmonsia] crescens]|uniref:DUF7600 domain-containing protein n=1 Tax=[Emmonsia] crescens TaxID=73230 RepID=A0A2B7Z5N3_9EURO|nr:hypothetical protein GX50_08534 [Emmonsia crescens]
MEFGHLFEFQQLWNGLDIQWYTLFWKVREISDSSDAGLPIRNRCRILPVVDHMVKLSIKYADKSIEGIKQDSIHPILLETDRFSAHQEKLTLPPSWEIKSLHISSIQIGSRQYISGLRINDSTSGLGYHHEDSCEIF